MLKYFAALLTIFALVSCKKTDTINGNGLVGNWKLIEVLFDPGDGSGKFRPVDSNKKITFALDSTFTSNGNICEMSIESTAGSRGVFMAVDKKITAENCNTVDLRYNLNENTLQIFYPCFEPCISKYVRVK